MVRGFIVAVVCGLSGCCSEVPVEWVPVPPVQLVDGHAEVDLASYLLEPVGDVTFEVDAEPPVMTTVTGEGTLVVDVPSDFSGEATLLWTARAECGGEDQVEVELTTSTGQEDGPCLTEFVYVSASTPEYVSLAGSFNNWSSESHPMVLEDGRWVARVDLEPGAYPYKFVEKGTSRFDGAESWVCDPDATFIQCDESYPGPWANDWVHACELGGESCNSMRVVDRCDRPTLEVVTVDQDTEAGAVVIEVEATEGASPIAEGLAWLNGQRLTDVWTGRGFEVNEAGLAAGRHTFRFQVTDAEGRVSEEAYVPLWMDAWSWEQAVVYFAFVDRVANGDVSNDSEEGATAELGEYQGGDYAGLTQMLPYLADMGVNVLWLSSPADNPEGAWSGDCEATYTGYHAYWPSSVEDVESHFGGADALKELVDAAHGLEMRVMMDWVANHVHQDHPYWQDHPEWFHGMEICSHSVDGQLNFDRIPERCWFAPYLPDFDYTQAAPLRQNVDDALAWVKSYGFDGFRVDAVKHVNHAVPYNLNAMLEREVEHRGAGSPTRFWTVGETFDSAERIHAYVGDQQLDGQFDFPMYYALRDAFIHDRMSLPDLMGALEASEGVYGDALMSSFLGNHDVDRWMTEALEGAQGVCLDGDSLRVAEIWADELEALPHFERMGLAWTWMFTQRYAPLIYYGDELGMPGYGDPDNRQPLWWHLEDPTTLTSVEVASGRLSALSASLLEHVAALGRARALHPSFYRGESVNWWYDDAVYGYARSSDGDHMIALFNREDAEVVLANSLEFAGLPGEGTYTDVLTGETFDAAGNWIEVPLAARQSRVLVTP